MTRRSLASAFVVISLLAAGAPRAQALEPAEIIEGVAGRAQALVSGRLSYTFKSQESSNGTLKPPKIYPEATTSFSESSWAERIKGSHVVRINHEGYFLEFVQTPQRDGSVRPGAILSPQRLLESRRELNAPPLFAGSFWFREQVRYVQQHADKFRLVRSATINGVPVEVLELDVPAGDHRAAFHVISPSLKQGGTLRISVAPQLGFVLPRVEFLTPAKQVAQVYEAVDFTEAAPGIYLPAQVWLELRDENGTPRTRSEFATRGELINQSIPEEDFEVELPLGTRVQDAREPGNVINFVLTEKSSSAEMTGGGAGLSPLFGFLDRWWNAVIVGVVFGCIASISLLAAARSQRHRDRTSRSPAHAIKA